MPTADPPRANGPVVVPAGPSAVVVAGSTAGFRDRQPFYAADRYVVAMARSDAAEAGPPLEAIEPVFRVSAVDRDGSTLRYFGRPLVPPEPLVRELWPVFREAGYEVRLTTADAVPGGRSATGDEGTTPRDGTGSVAEGSTRSTREDGTRSVREDGTRSAREDGSVGEERTTPRVDDTTSRVNDATPRIDDAASRVDDATEPRGQAASPMADDHRYVLLAEPVDVGIDGVPWTNVVLFVATVLSTLFAGAQWYYIDPFAEPTEIWRAWPFSVAILLVLGVHEMGHYVLSRYHRVNASLPYFLPVPTLIGTMGAVIKMKGRMPDRRALFDIGVAGPLAGLVATVAVTVVGLHLPPVNAPQEVVEESGVVIQLGYPPLLELLATAVDQPLYREDPTTAVNPVVIGGWVGMFVTFLNLIPVGQLDGGHILRAMIGELQETIGALVPGVLFALAGYLYYVGDYSGNSVFIWVFWGLFAALIAAAGPARPVDDGRLGRGRLLLGVVTFVLGVLCFMPVPIAIVG